MSLHKLTAGSGYDYLTRQVAAMDATDKGHTGLASYYTEKGETPGVWVGSGMEGIEGLDAGDIVTADHMQSLFGAGHHPLATQRTKELDLRVGRADVASPTEADYKAAARLGTPYKVYENDVSAFRVEVAKRLAAVNEAAGLPGDWPVPAQERARIRTEVGRDFFRAEHGREPADARELAATIAKHSRPKTNAVAGYDLTFSPVKSVSTLWALADPKTAAVIERAHQAAIKDALDFIETKALFTRQGTNGIRQVNVRGLLATAFTHRDSRAGDPDLHTHVAVANKVQTLDGKWLAIDGRLLYKAKVSASETYNTALERHLGDALGVRFAERPNPDARKRPVREIVGVDPDLNHRFSKRRVSVEARRKVLAAEFQATHGRPPTPIETLQLAQRATLETREAKHEPRSLAEQREAWNREAVEVLGSPRGLQQMLHGALNPTAAGDRPGRRRGVVRQDQRPDRDDDGRRPRHLAVLARLRRGPAPGAGRQRAHRPGQHRRRPAGQRGPRRPLGQHHSPLRRDLRAARAAQAGRRPRSTPSAASTCSPRSKVLAAEERLVEAAGRRDGYAVDEQNVALALLESDGQRGHPQRRPGHLGQGDGHLRRPAAAGDRARRLGQDHRDAGARPGLDRRRWQRDRPRPLSRGRGRAEASMGSQIDTQTDTLAKLTHSLITGDACPTGSPASAPRRSW